MTDFKHVPIKRQYTNKQLLFDILGALNRAIGELNLAVMNCEDYELNDYAAREVVKDDIMRVMKIVSDERDEVKRQIDILETAV